MTTETEEPTAEAKEMKPAKQPKAKGKPVAKSAKGKATGKPATKSAKGKATGKPATKSAEKKTEPALAPVRLANLVVDADIQSRDGKLNEQHIADLMEAIKRKADIPRVVVYKTTAGELILSDGFHRVEAYRRNGSGFVAAEIREGERLDAAMHATASNPGHGLKRTTADKRRAIMQTLKLSPKWSDRRIAEHVSVDAKTVGDVRSELEGRAEIPHAKERETASGKTVTVKEPKAKSAPKASKTEGPKAEAGNPEPTASAPLEQTSAPPQVDAMGFVVPAELAESFAGRELFERLVSLLKEARTLVTEIGEHKGGALLAKKLQWIRGDNKLGGRWSLADLDNAMAAVEEASPEIADCPYKYAENSDHDAGCGLCHGVGFVGPLKFRQVPAELVDKMKAAHAVEG